MHERSSYAVHRRARLDPKDVERLDHEVVEVRWYWGETLLGARHLRAGDRFALSSDPADRDADLCVEQRVLGGDSNRWVCIQQRFGRWVIALPPAVGGQGERALDRDETPVFWLGDIEVRVRRTRAGRGASRGGRPDRAMLAAWVGALVLALGFVCVLKQRDEVWRSMDGAGLLAAQDDRESYLRALIERSQRWARASDGGAASAGRAHDERAPGESRSAPRPQRSRGSQRRASRGAQRAPSAAGAADVGVLRALGAPRVRAAGDPFAGLRAAPDRAWGTSDTVADAFGFAGLGAGASGVGAGPSEADFACGCGGSISMGSMAFAPLDRGGAIAERARHHGDRALRARGTGAPRVCGGHASCAPIVVGHYPSEAIRRVVRANIGQVQHCYEQALALDASVEGRVSVRFVIGSEGSVLGAASEDNSTGSAPLGVCVARAFARLQFAPPRDGLAVTVTFPVQLQRD